MSDFLSNLGRSFFGPVDPAPDAGWTDPPPRKGFFTDTSVCIGCKACEVACKEWNAIPADGFDLLGSSYDNSGHLGANTWRHVAFIEQDAEAVARARESGRRVDLGMPRLRDTSTDEHAQAQLAAAVQFLQGQRSLRRLERHGVRADEPTGTQVVH